MDARLVDERNTERETDLLDLRVFISEETGRVSAYDVDAVPFMEARQWAASMVEGTAGRFSIAIRDVVDGRPGLVWSCRKPHWCCGGFLNSHAAARISFREIACSAGRTAGGPTEVAISRKRTEKGAQSEGVGAGARSGAFVARPQTPRYAIGSSASASRSRGAAALRATISRATASRSRPKKMYPMHSPMTAARVAASHHWRPSSRSRANVRANTPRRTRL